MAHATAIAASDSFRCSQVSSRNCEPPTSVPPSFDSRELKMKSIASPKSLRKASVVVIAPPLPASRG